MKHSPRDASRGTYSLRVVLVLLTLTLLVLLNGCAARTPNGAINQPGQQTTGQHSGGQPSSSGQGSGSNSPAQQIQTADQQIQDAMQGIDNAQNDANNANVQSTQENNSVP